MTRGEKQRIQSLLEGAGFTLVELLAVIVITVIGFLAMVNLQAGIIRGNTTTWDLVGATNLAQHVLETIRMEATEWTNESTQPVDQPQFRYLRFVNDGVVAPDGTSGSGWRRAFVQGGAPFQMVNQLGNDVGYDPGALVQFRTAANVQIQRRFCVRYRLTWLVQDFLIRAEVRVFWFRQMGTAGQFDACPMNLGANDDMQSDQNIANVYSVTYPTTVMKNVFVQPL